MTTAASAQTTPPKTTTTATHHAATAAAKQPTNPNSTLPKVVGIPKTLYTLKYIDIKIGTGPLAATHKWTTVHYTGWFPDGTKFDSSVDHGTPFVFPYGGHQVIIGWDTGFEGMHIGGKRRLFVPYQLAYGELGNPPRMPAKANLIFDVELLDQSDTRPEPARPTPPPAPQSDTPPPADAAPPADRPATPPQPQTPPHPDTH